METNTDLKSIIENYINNPTDEKFKFDLDFYLNLCKQKQTDSIFLNDLLLNLKTCVHMLDPQLFESSLINLVFFDIKWHLYHSKNKSLMNNLAEFLIDLNSAYTSLIYKCMIMLVKLFQIVDQTANQETDSIDSNKIFKFSHKIISALVKIAPSSKTNLVKLADSLYPYMIKDTLIQEVYIKNLLQITEYIPDIRINIFEICVQRMLKVDVNCTREQIIDSEMQSVKPEDENEQQETSVSSGMKLPFADRLDVMMAKLFDYIRSNCYKDVNDKSSLDWEKCRSIYKDLLFIFDKYILQTYGSSHVQFLLFYICSFRNLLAEGFLDYLWKRFVNPSSCAVTRQICTYYIGSLLSRAKYIPLNTCVATLQLIVSWIHNYINKTMNNFSSFDLHRTFYALAQTLFYVIIFRHRQLFQEGQTEILDLVKSWKLNEIITSKLNPLFYCLSTVTKKFSRITYINQVAYCYSIIDANNRVSLPIVSSTQTANNKRTFFSNQNDTFSTNNILKSGEEKEFKKKNKHLNENPLDSFFPFDPYLLKRSKLFIENIYQEFNDVIDDQMDLDSDEETDEDDEEEEDDESDDDDEDEDDDDDDDDSKINIEYTRKKLNLTNNRSHFDDSDIDNSIDDDDF